MVIENNKVLKEFYQSLSLSQYDEFIKELENYLPEEIIVDIKYLRTPPDRIVSHLNTKFKDLYYYGFKTHASIDVAISRALQRKKNFNESRFFERSRSA